MHDAASRRATSVIVHRIPPESAERFRAWQQGITAAAEGFPGYQSMETYPPPDAGQREWVIVMHFVDADAQQRWLASPVRAEWLARLPPEIEPFRLKTLPTGFGPWFASLLNAPLPSWKMALTVLLGLYPTVMLLNLFVAPHYHFLGLAASMLLGNALSICLLQWGVMPLLQTVLGPWLRADPVRDRARTVGGALLIVLVLLGLMLLFRQASG